RYRRRDDTMPRQFHANIPLEIVYTVIPFILVFGIFYFTVVTENEVDAVSAKPGEIIHVVAYRWGWQFTYYDGSHKAQGVTIQSPSPAKSGALDLAQPATSKAYPQLVLPLGSTVRID